MSSSFRDTFTRDDKKDYLLDYDDSAFYYFLGACIFVVALPWALALLKKFIFGSSQKALKGKRCRCSNCQKITRNFKKKAKRDWLKCSFFVQLCIVGALWYLFYFSMGQLEHQQAIKKFDPYEILGINENATESEIKSAWKNLTMEWHPDKSKNADSAEALAKIIMINRAYHALTDEDGKKNYQKYGNPDGPGSFNIGIGMPHFLLKEENHIQILIVFFLFILVMLPSSVLYWYFEISKYTEGGVLVENWKIIPYYLNENLTIKQCPEVLAAAIEFTDFVKGDQREIKDYEKLKKAMGNFISSSKHPKSKPAKLMLIVDAYMIGEKLPNPHFEKIHNHILEKGTKIITFMIECALAIPSHQKRMGLRLILTLIEFSQLFVQGIWMKDSTLLQLPYMGVETLKKFERKNKKMKQISDIFKFKKEDFKLDGILEDKEKEIFEDALSVFPHYSVKTDISVDGSDQIIEGDCLTIKVCIEKLNLKEKEKSGFIHSNYYPFPKYETIWLIIGEESKNKILYFKKINSLKRTHEEEIKIPFLLQGKLRLKIYLKSDSYKGLDHDSTQELTILSKDKRIAEEEEEPEEEAEPSIFMQMMDWCKQKSASDDELEEEEEEEQPDELEVKKSEKWKKRKERQTKMKKESQNKTDQKSIKQKEESKEESEEENKEEEVEESSSESDEDKKLKLN